ncbi:uncharacterized protein LOC118195979 [Stegodyphus dumicola]|uniref:uncharacterized protein LOC118195979 n=1 Tax=Stegodyphus dumicola TaxID=202533 RepID=UPI0015B08D70|nr:uncharacterized protein LOC118195979 [Stegodyphus dumicola]
MSTACEVGMNSIYSHEKEHLKDSKHKSNRKKHSSGGHINADSSTKDKHVPDNTKERKSFEHSKCKYKSPKHAHTLSNSDHFKIDTMRRHVNRGYEFSAPKSYIDNESRFSSEWHEEYNTDLVQEVEYLSKQVSYLTEENLRLSNALYNIKGHSEAETESEVYISFKEKRLDEKFSSILRDLIVELTSGHLDIQELKKFISSKKQNTNEVEENPEDLFSLDISTASETSYTVVPKYEASFNEILDKKDESDAKSEASDGK